MGSHKLVLALLLFCLVDGGWALTCLSANCAIGSSYSGCTAAQLAGTDGATTSGGNACYVSLRYFGNEIFLWRELSYDGCSDSVICGALSTTASLSTIWMQCCTGDMCNNLAISSGVTSLASMEQCYLGLTQAECLAANTVVQSGCSLVAAATTTPTPAVVTTLQKQIVTLSQNNSQVSNMQVWQLQENDLSVLYNLIYNKLAPYWPLSVTTLANSVNASKAQAVATNLMYAKETDIDIQNLYANLYNTTLQAETCCGWNYNTSYTSN